MSDEKSSGRTATLVVLALLIVGFGLISLCSGVMSSSGQSSDGWLYLTGLFIMIFLALLIS